MNNFVSLAADLRDDPETIRQALQAAKVLEGDENPFFQDTLGWAYYRAGEYEIALKHLKEASSGAQSNAEIRYHLGAAYLATNELDNARAALEQSLTLGGVNFRYRSQVEALLNKI